MVKFLKYKKIRNSYNWGARFLNNNFNLYGKKLSNEELQKTPKRTDVINYLLGKAIGETYYLEIGVRNPEHNFNKIIATKKVSVDPGIEYKENPVDFKMNSNEFFDKLKKGKILQSDIKFDVIFIDGLHLASQVDKDIESALHYIKDDGLIVLHDCNPPTEWHSREEYLYDLSPAGVYWNGTVWKAFFKQRFNKLVSCACIDTDWGVGIITKRKVFSLLSENFNPFYEYKIFDKNREKSLNLMDFDTFKSYI